MLIYVCIYIYMYIYIYITVSYIHTDAHNLTCNDSYRDTLTCQGTLTSGLEAFLQVVRPISLRFSLLRLLDSNFSGKFHRGLGIPPLKTKIVLESNPLKSRIAVRRFGRTGVRAWEHAAEGVTAKFARWRKPPASDQDHTGGGALLDSFQPGSGRTGSSQKCRNSPQWACAGKCGAKCGKLLQDIGICGKRCALKQHVASVGDLWHFCGDPSMIA